MECFTKLKQLISLLLGLTHLYVEFSCLRACPATMIVPLKL
jgi:hypothetical protein